MNPQDLKYQEAINAFEVSPPSGAWDAISDNLNRKKRRRFLAYFSAAASVIIASALFFNAQTTEQIVQQELTEEKTEPSSDPSLNKKNATPPNQQEEEIAQAQNYDRPAEESLEEKYVQNLQTAAKQEYPAENKSSKSPTPEIIVADNNSREETPALTPLPRKSIVKTQFPKAKPEDLNYSSIPSLSGVHKKNFILAIHYSPLAGGKNIYEVDPSSLSSLVVQKNLVDQRVVSNKVQPGYAQQVGIYGGIQITRNLDILAGVEWVQWRGKATLHLENQYEYQTIITSEITDPGTIQDISQKVDQGSISSTGEAIDLINQSNNLGFTGTEGFKVGPNTPSVSNIVSNKTNVEYSRMVLTERSTYLDTVEIQYNYSYFELPLLLRYTLGRGAWRATITGGASASFGGRTGTESVAVTQYDLTQNASMRNNQFRNWNAIFMAGLQYKAGSHVAFNLNPFGKWNLTPGNSPVGTPQSSFGIQLGAEYQF